MWYATNHQWQMNAAVRQKAQSWRPSLGDCRNHPSLCRTLAVASLISCQKSHQPANTTIQKLVNDREQEEIQTTQTLVPKRYIILLQFCDIRTQIKQFKCVIFSKHFITIKNSLHTWKLHYYPDLSQDFNRGFVPCGRPKYFTSIL